ncbi:MAG: hypothetical protein JJD97_06430 [Gemmatimonadaceae bacterium]|nr:hypothetical protein [Gemmatimonadaceae bacterium]
MPQQSAVRRLASFCVAFAIAGALACYQDKPATPANASATGSNAGAVLGLQPVPASHDSAIREIDSFPLTQEGVVRWSAAKQSLDAITKANPEIVKRLRGETPPKSIGEMGSRLESDPQLGSALKQAHIDGHTYMLTSVALQQAMHGFQLKQMGKLDAQKVPPVVMANIDFVATHLPLLMQSMRPAGLPASAPR